MFSIKPNVREVKPIVDSFDLTLTPLQMQYVTAVIGATVVSGSIPQECSGLYAAMLDALEDAGLVDADWTRTRIGEDGPDVNEHGVPYAGRLFKHLGLRGFLPRY